MPKFKLKTVVENLKDVPDGYRSQYTKRDGRFHLDEVDIDDGAEQGEQFKAATAELRVFKLEKPVREAALAAGVTEADIDDVLTITRKRFDLRAGKIVVLDEKGDETSLTPEKFFGEVFKTHRPKFYETTNASASESGGKKMTRADFDKLQPTAQMTFFKEGGVIAESAPASDTPINKTEKKTVQRAAFDQMSPADRMTTIKSGTTVVD